MTYDQLETISTEDLAQAIGGIDIGSMIQSIGGLADQFGAKGKGSQIAGMIAPIAQQFAGMIGGAGGSGGGGGGGGGGGNAAA